MQRLLKSTDLSGSCSKATESVRFFPLFLGYNLCFFWNVVYFPSRVGCALQIFCQIQWHAYFQHDPTAGKPLLISQAVTWTLSPSLKCSTNIRQRMRCKLEEKLEKDKRGNERVEIAVNKIAKQKAKVCMRVYVHVPACMSYICVCELVYIIEAKNSLSAGDASPLWCPACGFLVKPVKQHSIISTDAQMCSAGRCAQLGDVQNRRQWLAGIGVQQYKNTALSVGKVHFDTVI